MKTQRAASGKRPNVGRTEFLTDRLQVLRRVAVLHDRRTGNHLERTDLGDLGQDVVVHAIDEESVFFVRAPIRQRQHRDRLLSHNGCLLRLGFEDVVVHYQKDDSNHQQPDDREVEFAPRVASDRLSAVNLGFALDPLRRQLECPSENQG